MILKNIDLPIQKECLENMTSLMIDGSQDIYSSREKINFLKKNSALDFSSKGIITVLCEKKKVKDIKDFFGKDFPILEISDEKFEKELYSYMIYVSNQDLIIRNCK